MNESEQKMLDEWKRAAREWKARAEAAEETLTYLLDCGPYDADDDSWKPIVDLWCSGTVRRRLAAGVGDPFAPEPQAPPKPSYPAEDSGAIDEAAFYAALRGRSRLEREGVRFFDSIDALEEESARLGICADTASDIIEKWTAAGWFQWGVSHRSGWFTETAPEVLP